MVQGGGVDEEGFLADVVPGLPAWARRRGSLTTPEERLLEEEELDLLAAEVQRLVDGPLKTTSPHPQQTTRRGLLHSLRSLKRQPATFNLNTFDVSDSTTTTTTSRTGGVEEEVVVDEDEAEFLYDMGKRMLLGREGGMELQRNPRCAVHLLQRAAAMGHVGAKWDLHCCRGRGDDITLDYTRAAVLYARYLFVPTSSSSSPSPTIAAITLCVLGAGRTCVSLAEIGSRDMRKLSLVTCHLARERVFRYRPCCWRDAP
jgi:hypothetical protein